ncbi:MAG: transcription-repair coupling factor [Phycisphaerales bacterium]|nr:transcription-repair coupling factor [Phycisphaerales bacterium]
MTDPQHEHDGSAPEPPQLGGHPLGLLVRSSAVRRMAEDLAAGHRSVVTGVAESAVNLLAAATATVTGRPVVLVVAHLDDADEAADELEGLLPVVTLPALEHSPGSRAAAEPFLRRLDACRAAGSLEGASVVVCPIQALMQLVPGEAEVGAFSLTIEEGATLSQQELLRWLAASGYSRTDAVGEPGDFAVRGGIVDVFPAAGDSRGSPVRLDFFGDVVDKLSEFDPDSMATDRRVERVRLPVADAERMAPSDAGVCFLELLPRGAIAMLAETGEVVEQGRGYFERVSEPRGIIGPPAVLAHLERRFAALAEVNQFSAGAASADRRPDLGAGVLPTFPHDAAAATAELVSMARAGAIVCCQNQGEVDRANELLAEADAPTNIRVCACYVHRGFTWHDADAPPVAVVPFHELMSRFSVRRRAGRVRAGRAMDTFLTFESGDYVVHADHGIARFDGLKLMKPRDLPTAQRGAGRTPAEQEEYLVLEFASRARLYVPAMHIDKVQKYVGGFHGKPPLSTLGGTRWRAQKERVSESVRDLAAELMRVRAAREHLPGIAYPADTTWQREFEDEFPYEETEDQLASLSEIKKDMQRARPMDRLVCGDVGFGKTELAIRAAFKAVESGRQVAVLVPTTVLAEQHERTFRGRFAAYPFRVESVSRFKSDAQVKQTLDDLSRGQVDIIIGTHRVLSKDVRFADLGLVVIDEEQRFGVEHKESLLRLRLTVDVLTLSATPIPRTLHMAMLGIRDISSLTTAPLDRRAIVTEVIPFNTHRVRQAIERELAREGQVFYVHNRVHDIRSKADDIQRLVPDARIVVGHGQMPPEELEAVMLRFIRREADVLLSTTIIESGIDIASANTMIIDDADRFGLADLHQLRGRVGRGKHRGYCYALLPAERNVNEVARKRLQALEQYSMLGAGFKIAMRDLEIRGAGNILGAEQSGHIAAVGYEMYCQLLESAVHDLQHETPKVTASATSVEIGAGGLIPSGYIPSEPRRLDAYRRIASAQSQDQLDKARADLADAYGEPPAPVATLLDVASVRVACALLGVRTVTIREKDVVFTCEDPARVAAELTARAAGTPGTVTPLPPKSNETLSEVYFRPHAGALEPATLLPVLRRRLGLLTRSSQAAPQPAGPQNGRRARGTTPR